MLNITMGDPNTNGEFGDDKPRTIFIGNVPSDIRKRDLEDVFGEIGPIKRCHLQYPRKGQKDNGTMVAYITYALTEDATSAIEKLAGQKLGNQKLNMKLIKSRSDTFRREPRVDNFVPEVPVKKLRPKKNTKKARLIVRNVSFQATEDNLREHFSQCGEVQDVNILRKPNGKLVGCAFIQYKNVYEAMQALKNLNAQPHLDRTIVVDWAVPKEKYQTQNKEPEEVKTEDEEEDVKVPTDDEKPDVKQKGGNDQDGSDGDYDSEADEDDNVDEKPVVQKRQESTDADEGKTLFVRNLSFDCTEEELKEFFGQYGDVHYAVICKDRLTEHPKGTGFVKFKDLDSLDKCMCAYVEDETEFNLNNRQFYVSIAMSKRRLDEKLNTGKEVVKKDNRHLYLAREGFIRPGSDAAAGVSIADMNKRSTLNRTKKNMLKDLNVFVSETRLCVHNLPPELTDDGLRKIFKKHSDPSAKITEARVMRNMQTLNKESKEYAFVNFTRHEDALKALRTINNNPKIFSNNRRPIVEFSLENRKALTAKERRQQKSVENQQHKNAEEETANEKVSTRKEKRKKKKEAAAAAAADSANEDAEDEPVKKKVKLRKRNNPEEVPGFGGLTGKEGITSIPSFKAKGKISRKSLKAPKKKKMLSRRMREGKSKPRSNVDVEDKLDSMVKKHKKKLIEPSRVKAAGKKWFE